MTKEQISTLDSLDGRGINTDDIPEAPDAHWRNAVRGRFFRPLKQAVSLRLDMDVLDWLKRRGPGYQTEINQILRDKMEADAATERKA